MEPNLQKTCKNFINILTENGTTVLYFYDKDGKLQLLPLFPVGDDKISKAFFNSLAELEDALSLNKRSNDNDLAGALTALAGF